MDDDFNSAIAIAKLFELCSVIYAIKNQQIHTSKIHHTALDKIKKTFSDFIENIFGLKNENATASNNKLDEALQVLINLRKEAKAKKDFATSDAIRNQLAEKGIQLKDEKDGSVSWSMM
jgi:cysteinyl-tRNA synthetase